MKLSTFDTSHGQMTVVADNEAIYLLAFSNGKKLKRAIERVGERAKVVITPGTTPPMKTIEREIKQYFAGKLQTFATPYVMLGTPFQRKVWEALVTIPYGETQSYADVAASIRMPTAFRAVANANGANLLAIIIPCHRVINTGGGLGGYGYGLTMKKSFLTLESGKRD